MRLYKAIAEYVEARAELLREEAASLHLGKWAEGYKAGQADLMGCDCGCEDQVSGSPECG